LLIVQCRTINLTIDSLIFNDGTLATIAGVPQIRFHRDALSLEEAIYF
jgi:hypothetical protein